MKRLIILIYAILLAFQFSARADYPTRMKDERVMIYDVWAKSLHIYASPDHDNPGEVLIYYYIFNSTSDSVFLVFDKKGCEEMLRSLAASKQKLNEWYKVSKDNNVSNFRKKVDLDFPEVNVFWKQLCPRHGEFTYYPYFMWAGEKDWLQPELKVISPGAVYITFTFNVPDSLGNPYKISFSLNRPDIDKYPKHFDYEKIKRIYKERTPDRSGWDALFN